MLFQYRTPLLHYRTKQQTQTKPTPHN